MSLASNGIPNPKVEAQPETVEEIENRNDDNMVVRTGGGNVRAYVTVLVLFIINLLNYMDRQTVAGIAIFFQLKNIKNTEVR